MVLAVFLAQNEFSALTKLYIMEAQKCIHRLHSGFGFDETLKIQYLLTLIFSSKSKIHSSDSL